MIVIGNVFEWITVFGILTFGLVFSYLIGILNNFELIIILLVVNITVVLTMSGIFASYLKKKNNREN